MTPPPLWRLSTPPPLTDRIRGTIRCGGRERSTSVEVKKGPRTNSPPVLTPSGVDMRGLPGKGDDSSKPFPMGESSGDSTSHLVEQYDFNRSELEYLGPATQSQYNHPGKRSPLGHLEGIGGHHCVGIYCLLIPN